jgi:hypothetical protein
MYYDPHADRRFAVHASPSSVSEQILGGPHLLAPIDLEADSVFADGIRQQ